MFEGESGPFTNAAETPASLPLKPSQPEELLHARCGVYTRRESAERILDAVGWTSIANLSAARLLEPAAGDGAFVLAAADRLIASLRAHAQQLSKETLSPRIVAFELLAREAAAARTSVSCRLRDEGLSVEDAASVAAAWVQTRDFLIDPPAGTFSHVVGNPPYCRWSRIPMSLKTAYEAAVRADVAKGDIFLPFLDGGIELLARDGVLGFICSDRWKFMGFAEEFRARRLPQIEIVQDRPVDGDVAFTRAVDAYSSELVIRRRPAAKPTARKAKAPRSLAEAGYRVRVGPALGCTPAFVVASDHDGIEAELLTAWLDGRDVKDGELQPATRSVLTMHGPDGGLIDLKDFPGAAKHLRGYRKILTARAIVQVSRRPWYAPIDRVRAIDWSRPKLLVPELAREPRVALDTSGAIPSHGVYAVFAPDDDLAPLLKAWSAGGLGRALTGRAPLVKGGYVRCYKRFLNALSAPIS